MLEGIEKNPVFPAKLAGIIDLRGNPFSDDLMCLERGGWDQLGRTLHLGVDTPNAISFHKEFKVLMLIVGSRLLRYRYEFRFNEDLSVASIKIKLLCLTVPSWLAEFNMTDVSHAADGSLWERWSVLFGVPLESYWAERVVDSSGTPTKYFRHVVEETPELCMAWP